MALEVRRIVTGHDTKGKAVVASGAREAMEHNVEVLHGYGLWATVSHDR